MNQKSDSHRQETQPTSAHSSAAQTTKGESDIHLHGAALIDEQGREIPITEAMINNALKSLQFSGNTKTMHTHHTLKQ